ncbi:NUDIX hydrolase [Halosimplex pelagicum]|uniref:NUDIX hydrolase n=1 Tax=Halosimplex pelagicum TaxID=869886 RepID=A0A7D5SUL0_9EURY|nr:NUDIX hydrolase [Halosimplex pelagicum]QLH81427.1 NUDIX hydrolase [Halosimplex pelagicum]
MTDELTWETLDSRTSYTCEGFDIVTDTVRFPSGEEAEFDYLSEGESVVVLPFTSAGDVVAIEQWRQPVGRVNRALPAGSMEDEDADPEACVARELEEETGYLPGSVEHLTTVEPTNGFADAVFHYFVARDCEPTGERDLDYNEDIRVETTTFDALVDAAREDDLRDGRSMLGVLYFALFGEEQ